MPDTFTKTLTHSKISPLLNQVSLWQNPAKRVDSAALPRRISGLMIPTGFRSRLHRGWRVFATGFSFVAFGLGGCSLGLSLVLFLFPLPMPLQWKYRVVRRLVSHTFECYLFFLDKSGLFTRDIRNEQRLNRSGQLVIANHPSLLDVVFLISLIRQANCVIKQGVRQNKFTFIPSKIAGYITNEDEDMIARCEASLAQGDSLIIFPEGTRSTPGQPVKLLRGAANIAISSRRDITPVLIRCEPPNLVKGKKWYEVPVRTPHFHIEVLPDIPIAPYLIGPQSKAARQLTRDIEALYAQQLGLANP